MRGIAINDFYTVINIIQMTQYSHAKIQNSEKD